jgi:hypothetical protein
MQDTMYGIFPIETKSDCLLAFSRFRFTKGWSYRENIRKHIIKKAKEFRVDIPDFMLICEHEQREEECLLCQIRIVLNEG